MRSRGKKICSIINQKTLQLLLSELSRPRKIIITLGTNKDPTFGMLLLANLPNHYIRFHSNEFDRKITKEKIG